MQPTAAPPELSQAPGREDKGATACTTAAPERQYRVPVPRHIVSARDIPPPWQPLHRQRYVQSQLHDGRQQDSRLAAEAAKIFTAGSLNLPATPGEVQLGMDFTGASPRRRSRQQQSPRVPRKASPRAALVVHTRVATGAKKPSWCALPGRPLSDEGGRFSARGKGYTERIYLGANRVRMVGLRPASASARTATQSNAAATAVDLRPASASVCTASQSNAAAGAAAAKAAGAAPRAPSRPRSASIARHRRVHRPDQQPRDDSRFGSVRFDFTPRLRQQKAPVWGGRAKHTHIFDPLFTHGRALSTREPLCVY